MNTRDKIDLIKRTASDINYIEEEFKGKLLATTNGDVSLDTMIDFAAEYDWLLEMIIKAAREIKK